MIQFSFSTDMLSAFQTLSWTIFPAESSVELSVDFLQLILLSRVLFQHPRERQMGL